MGMATQIGFLIVFIGIMYLLLIRPQKKRERAVNDMRNSIQVGDEIITIGGICGKVVKTKDDTLIIQVGADKIKFEVMRWSISKIVDSPGKTAPKKSRPVEEEQENEETKKTLPKRMKRSVSSEEPVDAPEASAPEEEVIEVEAEVIEPEAETMEKKPDEENERW